MNKAEAIELLSGYHQRQSQIRLLRLEADALAQLPPTVPAAVYNNVATANGSHSSSVEHIAQKREQQCADLHKQITQLEGLNHKIDAVLAEITEPYHSILHCKYIKQQTWRSVAEQCVGYSFDYLRKELNHKALGLFVGLW